MAIRIHALQTGTVQVRERQRHGEGGARTRRLRTMLDRRWTEPLPIYAFLVEHPEGAILVDTGETARAMEPGYFPRWHPYFKLAVRAAVRPEEELGPLLAATGVASGDIRLVVMTHMHTDHAGGLAHVADREVLLSRREHDDAQGFSGQLNGYLPQRWPDGLRLIPVDFEPREYGPFTHSRPLTDAGDVHMVATPGHTPGHVSVVVEDGGRRAVIAGDASYTEQLMLDGIVDGVAPDPAQAADTLSRMRRLVGESESIYLPCHDPDSAARIAAGGFA
jgi:glyoxylase-like metal-dependent hydrolase (beta-lactamase superfamily II)